MNIMELGAIGELVGGVAVIASLIYVGLQVRQNTQVARVQTLSTRFSFQAGADALLAEDGAEAIAKAYEQAELSPAEIQRIAIYLYNALSALQTSFEAFERGLLGRGEWETARSNAPFYLGFPFGRAWWLDGRSVFPVTFVAEVDDVLRDADPNLAVAQHNRLKIAAQQLAAEA